MSFDREGDAPWVPLAAFVQVGVAHVQRPGIAGSDGARVARQDQLVMQQFSLLLAGRLSEHVGGFAQWSYDGLAHHSAVDNVDIRWADRQRAEGLDLRYGLSLNNSPTVSDIYNATPVWGFPFASAGNAPTPAAATLIQEGLAQQVAGLTAYAMWNQRLYAELGAYRTASGLFSPLRAGVDRRTAAVLDGLAPYGRLALQHEWDEGSRSAMLGTFGLVARRYTEPGASAGPSDRFKDLGIDAQVQAIGEVHRFSGQIAYIHERQDLGGSVSTGAASNAANRLNSLAAKLSYYYRTRYGISLGYQRMRGDADAALYSTGEPLDGSANGSPNSAAAILELNWLPWRDRRFTLQYTAYQTFNGARHNYDGFGRNARDNNALGLLAWLPF